MEVDPTRPFIIEKVDCSSHKNIVPTRKKVPICSAAFAWRVNSKDTAPRNQGIAAEDSLNDTHIYGALIRWTIFLWGITNWSKKTKLTRENIARKQWKPLYGQLQRTEAILYQNEAKLCVDVGRTPMKRKSRKTRNSSEFPGCTADSFIFKWCWPNNRTETKGSCPNGKG